MNIPPNDNDLPYLDDYDDFGWDDFDEDIEWYCPHCGEYYCVCDEDFDLYNEYDEDYEYDHYDDFDDFDWDYDPFLNW